MTRFFSFILQMNQYLFWWCLPFRRRMQNISICRCRIYFNCTSCLLFITSIQIRYRKTVNDEKKAGNNKTCTLKLICCWLWPQWTKPNQLKEQKNTHTHGLKQINKTNKLLRMRQWANIQIRLKESVEEEYAKVSLSLYLMESLKKKKWKKTVLNEYRTNKAFL